MKKFAKAMTGAAAAALVTIGAAAPAHAQYYDPYYDRDRGIDTSDIVRGVAIAGAAAAAVGAIANAARGYGTYGYPSRGYGTYGYPSQGAYGYGNNERYAVDACARRAARYGRVSVTQVYPRSRTSLRVEGVVDGNNGYYNRGYGYDRYGYDRGYERRAFQCNVRYDGRVTSFDTDRIRY